jgi:hypothetical protein
MAGEAGSISGLMRLCRHEKRASAIVLAGFVIFITSGRRAPWGHLFGLSLGHQGLTGPPFVNEIKEPLDW